MQTTKRTEREVIEHRLDLPSTSCELSSKWVPSGTSSLSVARLLELRIAAKVSEDKEMLSAYAEDRDLHTFTAQNLTGRQEISKDDRKLAKEGSQLRAALWNGSERVTVLCPDKLRRKEEARFYRRRFFETYPRLKRWHYWERRAWQCGDTETRHLVVGLEKRCKS